MTGVAMPEGVLTDDLVEHMKTQIGLELRIDHSVFNDRATPVALAKFVDGIGDPNPLWRDPTYAASTRYGGVVAPPSWIIGCFSGIQFGWAGLGSFHSGTDIVFERPVRLDDVLSPSCTYEGFDGPKPSTFAGRMVVDHFRNVYRNQRDERVAQLRWSVMNFERGEAKDRSSEAALDVPHRWSDEEVAAIEAEVLAEAPRGGEPRWWEDVNVGDRVDELLKGPIGLTDEIAFVAGGGAPIPRLSAHASALRAYEKHPGWWFRDTTTGAREPIYSVHYSRNAAQAMGAAMEYDVGFQRQCWHVQLLTNWMGDDGWLKSVSAQYRAFVYLADVVRLGGRVTRKYLDGDGDPVVEVETWARNQRGADVMPGRATVALRSRTMGLDPVERRLRSR